MAKGLFFSLTDWKKRSILQLTDLVNQKPATTFAAFGSRLFMSIVD
ncbi:hypothetical protein [Brevibacillus choshinensis]|uniref:Transposase n=1 Tax=Brevibacillus choshinensis TaxID=54911 RepID=A0ABX7FSG9_BRECH|nr:hypothetical protein [Brevibacillus choshinensis]QRG68654.1 hypothetical protein JNE38_05755 [Brevibacillus choshinensis]